jgi:ABC-type transport system involved in cytochrome c biogenesis permease subunit
VSGHPPILGTLENVLAATWFLGALLVWAELKRTAYRDVIHVSYLPWILALLVWGLRYPDRITPLTISEQSIWVDIHAAAAWLAFAAFLFAFGLAVLTLVSRHRAEPPVWLPERPELDRLMLRSLSLTFIAASVMMATGAWYSLVLFGRWLVWEVVLICALVLWLGVAVAVHARLFFGWRGSRLAWVVLLLLPAAILTFWVWSAYQGTYHSFDFQLLRAGDL